MPLDRLIHRRLHDHGRRWHQRSVAFAGVTILSAFWFLMSGARASGGDLISATDIRLSLAARTTIAEDFRFFYLNLGVPVRDGKATVWGVVPSEESAAQIVALVAKVKGIKSVRNDLVILSEEDWPDQWRRVRPILRPLDSWAPAGTQIAVSLRPALALDDNPFPEARIPAAPQPAFQPVAPGQFASKERPPDLYADLQAIRRSDPRFHDIEIVLEERVAHVRGQGAILFTLAERIAAVAGVERVIVEQVTPQRGTGR